MQIWGYLLPKISPLFLVTLAAPKFVPMPIKLQLSAWILAAQLLPRLGIALKRKIHLNMDFYPVQFFSCKGKIPSSFCLLLFALQCLQIVVLHILSRVYNCYPCEGYLNTRCFPITGPRTYQLLFWIVSEHTVVFFSSGTVGEKTMRVVVVETDYVDFSLGITDGGLQVH